MSNFTPLREEQIAWRVVQDIPDGAYVNLGIGMPTLLLNVPCPGREIVYQCENGILGLGPEAAAGEEDWDLFVVGRKAVTLVPGGCYFHHADAFAMIRGGHVDIAVLGAFQVSARGDLANWMTTEDSVPAVGGAMDLAVGARSVYVTMKHVTKGGEPKIVSACMYPLTAAGVVKRIYTDLSVIDVTPDGLLVREVVAGLDLDGLQRLTGAPLRAGERLAVLRAPDRPGAEGSSVDQVHQTSAGE